MSNFVENHAVINFCHLCNFMMGLGLIGKPKLLAKFKVAGFIYYRNIRGFMLNQNGEISYYLQNCPK